MTKSFRFPQYKQSEFERVSWEEYGKVLESIAKNIETFLKKNRMHIDTVVPIYRAAGIAGQFFAYRLHNLKILPVQYKYLHQRGKVRLVKLDDSALARIKGRSPTILVVENNHCFGTTSRMALRGIRKKFPKATILYVAIYADYSHRDMPGADYVFYGRLTNETKALLPTEAKKLKLQPGLALFPWENIEEEWAAVRLKKFDYK